MKFSVSVIIPVYNCENFIEKAISSVLEQPEVIEVLVINDGSIDNTTQILDKLKEQNSKIKLYHHKNGINKGRSATRNLGIEKAIGNYIAFLDADDYYLPNRFKNDKIHFDNNLTSDGIYNAIGVHFYRDPSQLEKERLTLYSVKKIVEPNFLFETLISGKHGHFHINGLTVKKSVFNVIGFFNEELEVAEDTDIFWKLSLKCHLFAGTINEPVAMRGVHQKNVFNDIKLYDKIRPKVYESLLYWSAKKNVSLIKIDSLLNFLWILRYKQEKELFENVIYWATMFFKNQRLLFSYLSIKYFPLVRLRKKLFPFLYK